MRSFRISGLGSLFGMGADTQMTISTAVRTSKRGGRRVAAFAATIAAAASVLCVVAPSAGAAPGDGFSFAETTDSDSGTSAPAFPGTRAFWAGVCDLYAADFVVGSAPSLPFGNCIDHPAAGPAFGDDLQPPLSPGLVVGNPSDLADGWRRSTGELGGPSWRLGDVKQAGGHPDGTASFWFSRGVAPVRADVGGGAVGGANGVPDGAPRSVRVSLPAGVLANPLAVPQCPSEALVNAPSSCPPKSQVGVSTISLDETVASYPVYNVEPRDGKTAEFMISGVGLDIAYVVNQPIVAEVRTDGDFGADGFAGEISAATPVVGQTITLWGVPWAKSHDRYRPVADYCKGPQGTDFYGGNSAASSGMPVPGLSGGMRGSCSQERVSYDPSWGPIKPFFATQTECSAQNPITRIHATNWNTSKVADGESPAPLITDCGELSFPASFGMASTTSQADAASGLDVDLSIPQNNDPPASVRFNADDVSGAPEYWKTPAGRAVSHLKDSVVTLPEGFSVNPSAATGLDGCSDGQIGLVDGSASPPRFSDGDPFDQAGAVECPSGSVIGTARVHTPLLEQELSGEVVLGMPRSTDPMSGEMLRLFIVVRNRDRGLVAKVYGTATADPATGRIKATFKNNPQVPFDELELAFKDGPKGVLATPRACGGQNTWTSSLSPWSGNAPVDQAGQFAVDQGCTNSFAPALQAGMDTKAARSNGTFSFKFSRQPGEQYLRGLTAVLPKGLLASVKDVPLCTNAQAVAASCPAGSKIGVVDAKAGAGDPFVLEEKGEVFLTEGYKGGQYGLAVKVRPIAGPFRGAMELSPIVVRQAIHVDRSTTQVTAISDPFPLIHHGVPLRVREVTVLVNRPSFMLNPSDCSAKQVGADLASDQGANAGLATGFQAAGCAGLAFKPKLTLALTGRKQVKTGKHPGIKAVVTQNGIPEAGIKKAEVRLPKSLALDVDNAQALCEFADGTKPDLENHCPKGSIVGRARAASPLLNDPLVGNVYFVKNVRRDAKTGNLIRTLPMIVVALRGEIAVNLKGESNTTKDGKLVNTFDQVPDAPISKFNLNINGGNNGILAVTRTRKALINLCAGGRHVAEADMDGQNGRQHDFDITMTKPCTKRQTKAAKRQAKRAAAKRAAARG
jgi:hypothetical protein